MIFLFFSDQNMFLKAIQINNFKNCQEATCLFAEKVNAIVGENGSGKTNLLDAIHYLSFCKSYFSSQDGFSVRFGEDFFALHGDFVGLDDERMRKVSCTYKLNGRKSMKINQKEYDRLSDHIGQYPLIMVSPYDNELIQNGSEVRRKFFDMVMSQFDKEYLQQLIDYQKIISQRNTLLKQCFDSGSIDYSLLGIYDGQLVPLGENIYRKREAFIEAMAPAFQKYYNYLSDNKENVKILYQSQLADKSFATALEESIANDLRAGYTTVGVHKDDYIFLMNDHLVKRFSSQGQQKSFALALKLSQFDYIFEQKKIKPILLLDDIFDKLDEQRIDKLLHLMGDNHFGQVFLSDTVKNRITSILDAYNILYKIFEVKNGHIEEA